MAIRSLGERFFAVASLAEDREFSEIRLGLVCRLAADMIVIPSAVKINELKILGSAVGEVDGSSHRIPGRVRFSSEMHVSNQGNVASVGASDLDTPVL